MFNTMLSILYIVVTKLLLITGNQLMEEHYHTVVMSGNYSTNITVTVNANKEYIIHFQDSKSKFPYTIVASSNQTNADFPVFVMVRQQKEAISWEIPFLVQSREGTLSYQKTSRTLCHNNINALSKMPRKMLYAGASPAKVFDIHKRLTLSISTASSFPANVTVCVEEEDKFFVEERKNYSLTISPSMPKYYYYKYPDNRQTEATVVLEVNSYDDTCLTVSIQNASCPVFDLNQDISYEGKYETVNNKGGIIIKESEYPNGFFIVFVSKGDNFDCDQKGSIIPSQGVQNIRPSNHSSVVTFQIIPNISRDEYLVNSLLTLAVLLLFFIIFGMVSYEFCFYGKRCRQDNVREGYQSLLEDPPPSGSGLESSSSSRNTPTGFPNDLAEVSQVIVHNSAEGDTRIQNENVLGSRDSLYYSFSNIGPSISTDEHICPAPMIDVIQAPRVKDAQTNTDDTVDDDKIDKKLDCPKLFLSDLATKESKDIHRESVNYLMHVISIGIFYGIPVFQLVITQQRIVNVTGNLDICYYNFLCAHPYIGLNDFNHVFSNSGYILLGILFLIITKRHQNMAHNRNCGIPKHYGLYYAMATALGMEGFLSGCYHICPNQSNFQFDTSFMYVMAVLCIIKLYQNRHPDINATAYVVFLILSVIIIIAMAGILFGYFWIWCLFTVCYCLLCICVGLQVYFTNDSVRGIARVYSKRNTDGILNAIKPIKIARCILLMIITILNIVMVIVGFLLCYKFGIDFGTFVLGLLMANALFYVAFYIAMKLYLFCCQKVQHERISLEAAFYLIIMTLLWAVAGYCYLNNSSDWTVTPSESRHWNTHCTVGNFYDYHDIWHLTSAAALFTSFMLLLTIDDELADTPRDRILVF